MADRPRTPRERYREQTRGEIKASAVRRLAEGGVENVALLRIAKEIGLSGPALYRYFAGRDELLAELVTDAYQAVAEAVAGVGTTGGGRAALQALAAAYRDWALAQPHLYLLIQGTPVPGFEAPADTLARARAVLGPFLAVFAGGRARPALAPLTAESAAWLREDAGVAAWVAEWTGRTADDPAAAVALTGAVMAWPQLHGVVGLEAAGQFTGMGQRPATLLPLQIGLLADAFHLP
ncbi:MULTISPECIES: TetR/AcrR family transcriptional regulator [Streptomyces diastaticus group]|uniref:TetR family transcriptional regulator n=3 Tax=Streptomyces diastaticus group TaxID=2849069 RepID=A0A8H9HP23_9ACTN|nr:MULTISPECIES: TetR/AcrR family transcriptional regulator [Streptomyces diastaticus group]NEE29211.1 TetR/AcrR family transcriptional regulator [Streptomyces sp. SID7982]QNE82467.1 TetR family transcriptional regulator [Streptomyces rutgersensis]GFH64247.1 TetR family transcriptional regulator [Streptomyces rutgersensis]GFH69846.1 TetR family transcriptional regulator [Streptomyces diastaticus subsp. diastaticus]GFH78148.1 TetR family transcriptional regulator [Streptomyces gougerotii]